MTRLRLPFLRDTDDCEEVRSLMTDYLDEDLEASAHGKVERHVRFCPPCRRVLSNLRTTIDRLAHLEPHEPEERDTPAEQDRDTPAEQDEDELVERLRRSWRGPTE